jgi:hypothetical protein
MAQQRHRRIKPRQNCWEFKKCGREPGGVNAAERGICPASREATFDGLNFGKNGGRICWAIAGTFCAEGEPVGEFAAQLLSCMDCDFFKKVRAEEGSANFELLIPRQKYLKKMSVA